mgnify:CR=1 FL=1
MLWLVALVPLLAAAIVHASPMQRRPALGATGCGVLLVTLLLTVFAGLDGWVGRFAWSTPLQFEVVLTSRSVVMALLVPVIALPVLAYAAAHERLQGLNRLVSLLLLFVGAMLLLVIAADLITLLIGWELVGACSWALIGHERQRASHAASARYAFVMTRFGDLGLFVAAMVVFSDTGTFAFAALETLGAPQQTVLVAGIVLSAASKSGQLPFAPWLFRAMDGPTSVSALLHSATMVAAGAYLLIRLEPILAQMPWFGPAHPSPVRIEQNVVAVFLKAYTEKSKRANVGVIPEVVKTVEKALAHAVKKNKKVKKKQKKEHSKGMRTNQKWRMRMRMR